MTRIPLAQMSLDALAGRFEQLCLSQYRSLEREEIAAYNRRYRDIEAIINELKLRPGDQRRILQRFFNHRNAQVSLTAAHANLAIDYNQARRVLEEIAASAMGSQQLDAGMALDLLDDGTYRPT